MYIAKTLEFLPLRLGQLHAYLRILALINTVNSTFHGGWNCLFPNSYASIELGSSVLHLFDSPHFLGFLLSQTKFNTECLVFFCHLKSTLCFFTSARLIFFYTSSNLVASVEIREQNSSKVCFDFKLINAFNLFLLLYLAVIIVLIVFYWNYH